MKNNDLKEKTLSVSEVLSSLEKQLNLYPEGKAWGAASPSYVRHEIEKLADDDQRIPLTRLCGALLRMFEGRAPGNVNEALQGIIVHASRQCSGITKHCFA